MTKVSLPALMALMGLVALSAGCTRLLARSDDAFEPNDTLDRASPLTAGQAIQARANQGNADVFSLQAPEGKTILFRLQSVGLENCPAFTATGPGGKVLFHDRPYHCHTGRDPRTQPAESVEGVTLTQTPGSGIGSGSSSNAGYELRVPAATAAGTYFLTIEEQGEADNIFPLSWDYQLTATLE